MKAKTKTKPYEKVVDHIMQGSHHMSHGNYAQATAHFRHAKRYAREHANVLHALGNHEEKKDFEADFNNLISAKEKQLQEKRGAQKSEAISINEVYDNVYMFDPLHKSDYEYKWLHELHPDDIASITGRLGRAKYPGSLHHDYVYPTDSNGRLVHAPRKPVVANNSNALQRLSAHRAQMRDMDMPSFKEGQGVRVSNENHKHHGSFGVVQAPHHDNPGHVHVKLSNGDNVFIKPADLSISKDKKIAKSIIILDEIRNKRRQ